MFLPPGWCLSLSWTINLEASLLLVFHRGAFSFHDLPLRSCFFLYLIASESMFSSFGDSSVEVVFLFATGIERPSFVFTRV